VPGYRPWTRRFTPTVAEPPMSVKLERLDGSILGPTDTGPKPLDSAPVPGQPSPTKDNPTVIISKGTENPAPPPDAPEEPAKEPEPVVKVDPTFHEMSYPTRLITLRPYYNAFPVGEYPTATIDLGGAGYAVWTDGSVVLRDGRGGASSTLAYFAAHHQGRAQAPRLRAG
jgi:hypothetical protein